MDNHNRELLRLNLKERDAGASELKKLTTDYVVDRQLEWASRGNIPLVGRYTLRVEDNIFGGGLHPETKKEYERGKGHELEGKRAHMKALYSSSALVVNVFDYWRRQTKIQDIATCCGVKSIVSGMEFEKIHPISTLSLLQRFRSPSSRSSPSHIGA